MTACCCFLVSLYFKKDLGVIYMSVIMLFVYFSKVRESDKDYYQDPKKINEMKKSLKASGFIEPAKPWYSL